MAEFITLILILIPVMVYFVVTFYASNKVYIDIIVLVVIDRMEDYVYYKCESFKEYSHLKAKMVQKYYYEYKFNIVKRVVSTYKSAVSCFKR